MDDVSDESDGTATPIEAKIKVSFWSNISQLVGTCMTSSFTEHRLHPTMNTLVPTIIIDRFVVQICLYDCEHDVEKSCPHFLVHHYTAIDKPCDMSNAFLAISFRHC